MDFSTSCGIFMNTLKVGVEVYNCPTKSFVIRILFSISNNIESRYITPINGKSRNGRLVTAKENNSVCVSYSVHEIIQNSVIKVPSTRI